MRYGLMEDCMKQITVYLVMVAVLCLPPTHSSLAVDDVPAKMDSLATETLKLALPGPEHELLKRIEGEFDATYRLWGTPGSAPTVFYSETKNRMILGGRFLESYSKVTEGMFRVESMSYVGFDRRHKKFTTIGMDTFGTYYITAEGTFDEEKSAIVFSGTDEDPVTGITQEFDIILKIISDDEYISEVIFKDDVMSQGTGAFRMVEIVSKRKK